MQINFVRIPIRQLESGCEERSVLGKGFSYKEPKGSSLKNLHPNRYILNGLVRETPHFKSLRSTTAIVFQVFWVFPLPVWFGRLLN